MNNGSQPTPGTRPRRSDGSPPPSPPLPSRPVSRAGAGARRRPGMSAAPRPDAPAHPTGAPSAPSAGATACRRPPEHRASPGGRPTGTRGNTRQKRDRRGRRGGWRGSKPGGGRGGCPPVGRPVPPIPRVTRSRRTEHGARLTVAAERRAARPRPAAGRADLHPG